MAATTTRPADATAPAHVPGMDVVREVRLGLVMYGGVSLAIYMNGVSQELFHLVRSTAPKTLRPPASTEPAGPDPSTEPAGPDPSTEPLVARPTGTETVYRRLGQALEAVRWDPNAPLLGDEIAGRDITTRFVIDILSGSSAGGINAIFLAKSLANDQDFGSLEDLWQRQGDISVLLNDKHSAEQGLSMEHPPQSLLNSGRMYLELFRAFEQMERAKKNAGESASPYVQELDLWVTTTDLRGVTLPLQLSSGLAWERRYRNVFHFVYGTEEASGGDRNDFRDENDPMLAFAARCTSAFPFAFRPMEFGDMGETLAQSDRFRAVRLEDYPWKQFYADYFPPETTLGRQDLEPERQVPFRTRPFADGGALDNKPFTWTTDTLSRRRADMPVDRKLIYIEPDPGHPENAATPQGRPNAIQNFAIQGLLPRQETIREDLQAVLDRNRTIERVDRVLQGIVEDLYPEPGQRRPVAETDTPWDQQDVDDGISRYGQGYGGYLRLKVATVTDDLTSLVASLARFDEASDEFLAARYLVRAWRDRTYAYRPAEGRQSFNVFLQAFDLQHRLRRLAFLRTRADALYALDTGARDVIKQATGADVDDAGAFRDELRAVKRSLSDVYVRLRVLGRRLRTPGPPAASPAPAPGPAAEPAPVATTRSSPVQPFLAKLSIKRTDLHGIIEPRTEEGRQQQAAGLLAGGDREAVLQGFADEVGACLRDGLPAEDEGERYGTVRASTDLAAALDPEQAGTPDGHLARQVLLAYCDSFDDFDMVAYPMLYGTDAGETDPVEILRIAPEDATSIFDERGIGFRKTRGWKYSHFGAFLDPVWRKNDIMWGRLDAAECIIDALVPPEHPERLPLLRMAQRAIIEDCLSKAKWPEQRQAVFGDDDVAALTDDEVVERFQQQYEVENTLEAGTAWPTLARGVDVTGKVLKGISGDKGPGKGPVGLFARLGAIMAGLVELAVPGAPRGMILRRILPALVVFEAALLLIGIVFRAPSFRNVGVVLLAVTLLVWAVVGLLAWAMRGSHWPARIARVAVLVAVLAVFGFVVIAAMAGIGHDWTHPSRYVDDLNALYDQLRHATPTPTVAP